MTRTPLELEDLLEMDSRQLHALMETGSRPDPEARRH